MTDFSDSQMFIFFMVDGRDVIGWPERSSWSHPEVSLIRDGFLNVVTASPDRLHIMVMQAGVAAIRKLTISEAVEHRRRAMGGAMSTRPGTSAPEPGEPQPRKTAKWPWRLFQS